MTLLEPHGMGVYARALAPHIHVSPEHTAQVAADHGLRFVPLLACWQEMRDGRFHQRAINAPALIARYAEALAARGVQPALWFYPWGGRENQLLDHIDEVLVVCDGTIVGLLPDPELGYKWRRGRARPAGAAMANMRGQPEAIPGRGAGDMGQRIAQARALMGGLVDLMTEAMWLMVTSYGLARFHPNFPWETFLEYGGLSGQLYGASPRETESGMEEWARLARDPRLKRQYLPSIATYGPTAQGRLRATLSVWDGHPIQGMCAWSWPQTDAMEWRVLQEWGERFED